MTTTKATTNKAVASIKKPANAKVKKEVEKVTVDTVEATNTVETTAPSPTPARAKKVEIDRNEMVTVRSATDGDLIYVSNRTKSKYIWEGYNSELQIDMGELQDMKGSRGKFLTDCHLIIDDEEAAEALGLSKIYQDLIGLEDLEEFILNTQNNDLETILPKLPKALKASIGTVARKLVEEDTLDTRNKIKLIEAKLGVDLQLFIK